MELEKIDTRHLPVPQIAKGRLAKHKAKKDASYRDTQPKLARAVNRANLRAEKRFGVRNWVKYGGEAASPGNARVPPAGFGVPPKRTFVTSCEGTVG